MDKQQNENMDVSEEKTIWRDRKHFMWFPFSFTVYEVRNDRLYKQVGLLNTIYDEVLLYRIVDITMRQTIWQKIFGTGTVILTAKVNRESEIYLKNIKQPKMVNSLLSDLVEEARDKKRVVGKEFYDSHNDNGFEFDEEE